MKVKKAATKRTSLKKKAKPRPLNGKLMHHGEIGQKAGASPGPWKKYAGMFANDPVFESVVDHVAKKRKQRRLNPDIP